MEEIKAYIESGILELYVLGDITSAEKLQVEEMAAKHPVIKAELNEIESSMESFAAENAIEPAEDLRQRIMNSLVTNLGDDNNFPNKKEVNRDNVVAFTAPKTTNFYKYAFAACLTLLLASIVVIISLSGKLNDATTQLVVLNSQNQHFTKTVNYMDHQLNIYRDPGYKIIKLIGTPKHASSSMLVAFSPAKKKVMIDLADLQLPDNDKTHQYQLWALVGGKPVDLGVFDKTSSADSAEMKQMKSLELAQAFAVTLEPRGGSVSPTMDQMMVIGTF